MRSKQQTQAYVYIVIHCVLDLSPVIQNLSYHVSSVPSYDKNLPASSFLSPRTTFSWPATLSFGSKGAYEPPMSVLTQPGFSAIEMMSGRVFTCLCVWNPLGDWPSHTENGTRDVRAC